MSLSIDKKLGLGEVKPKIMKFLLAYRSYIFLRGEIENIFIKVDMFIFPADILILDMKEDKDVTIIMRQPFFTKRRTVIDVVVGELIMRVINEQVVFNIFKAIEYIETTDDCFAINIIEQTATKVHERS